MTFGAERARTKAKVWPGKRGPGMLEELKQVQGGRTDRAREGVGREAAEGGWCQATLTHRGQEARHVPSLPRHRGRVWSRGEV